MQNNVKIFFILILTTLIASVPLSAYSYKTEQTKRSLNLDMERYEEINTVCVADKNPGVCKNYLQEDLSLLIKVHQKNNKIINSPMNFTKPKYLAKILYKEQENVSTIEPEILLKTLLLKRVMFRDLKNPVQAEILGAQMENYIVEKFSDSNKSSYLSALQNQDKSFEKYTRKLKIKEENRKKKDALSSKKADILTSDYY